MRMAPVVLEPFFLKPLRRSLFGQIAGRRGQVMEFFAKHRGQGLVEYAFVIVLIALVILVILALLGASLGEVFSRITGTI